MFILRLFALFGASSFSTAIAADPQSASSLTLNQIADLVQKLAWLLGICIGAGWAYFRFVRFRTLKKRVEFSFEWKSSATNDGRLLGILTVKLSNKGNTPISLRNNDDFRCPLTYSLVRVGKADKPVVYLNSRPQDLLPLPFLFKAHRLVEPSETIDDVAILSLDVGDAIAIQFQAQVLSVRSNGKRESLMSSVSAFSLTTTSDASVAVSEDEQDEYDEIKEVRLLLAGWVGEAQSVLSRGNAGKQEEQIQALVLDAELLIHQLDKAPSPENVEAASTIAEELKAVVRPFI
jgi:hypothetical protein